MRADLSADSAPRAMPSVGDRRSEDGPDWLGNGLRVQLAGLQTKADLNGQIGVIVGYHDEHRRYRVQLEADGVIKLIPRKNLTDLRPGRPAPAATETRLLPSPSTPPRPSAPPLPAGETVLPGPSEPSAPPLPAGLGESLLAMQDALATQPHSAEEAASAPFMGTSFRTPVAFSPPPTRDMVLEAIRKINRDVEFLRQHCDARQQGRLVVGEAITETFLRLSSSIDEYLEVSERYSQIFGEEEELKAEGVLAIERSDECTDVYHGLRTWPEYLQDEWNLTRCSIRKHGVVGTLKKEVVEVGRDAADMGSAASTVVPGLVQQVAVTVGDAVQTGSQRATTVVGRAAVQGQQRAVSTLQDRVVRPVKQAWHLVVFGLLLCYVFPLFGLRPFAPLNTVVANVGILYAGMCICFPPAWARRRAVKAGLILLWPVLFVALPLLIHCRATLPWSARHGVLLPPPYEVQPGSGTLSAEGGRRGARRREAGPAAGAPRLRTRRIGEPGPEAALEAGDRRWLAVFRIYRRACGVLSTILERLRHALGLTVQPQRLTSRRQLRLSSAGGAGEI